MNKNLIIQLEQFWKIFIAIVDDFEKQSWNNYGYGFTKPPRISFHIIQSMKYYMDDTSDIILSDGRILCHDHNINACDTEISQEDIHYIINNFHDTAIEWIKNLDLLKINERCTWTGNNLESVVLFIIRHSYFHLGELNAMLNDHKKGEAFDHFASNIN